MHRCIVCTTGSRIKILLYQEHYVRWYDRMSPARIGRCTIAQMVLQRMMQAGLIKKAQVETIWKIRLEIKIRTALTKKNFNVMLLKQLTFTFYVLGFGYACAIIIFALEMAIGCSTFPYVKTEGQPRREWRSTLAFHPEFLFKFSRSDRIYLYLEKNSLPNRPSE